MNFKQTGALVLPIDLLDGDLSVVSQVTNGMVIVGTELSERHIHYFAVSEHFRELPLGPNTPVVFYCVHLYRSPEGLFTIHFQESGEADDELFLFNDDFVKGA